ncbi:MAG TPA: potassium-transporting ATPase subunit KdpA [Planctomycetota bacterium]|nr:potassium-transporting ATPase subunit KdpA [Planctomycetota bacterium]
MSFGSWLQIGVYFAVLLALVKPLGAYMARVYEGGKTGLEPALGRLERLLYRLCGVRSDGGAGWQEMNWKTYAIAMLAFNGVGLVAVYLLQRFQGVLPLNPANLGAVSPDSAFNTAVSFATNTNWQGYGGESTMSYLTQALGLCVQNFVSAASGMAVLAALVRGFARSRAETIGNFWVDLVRSTLYVLLPLSLVLSIVLVSQGMLQNFSAYKTVELLQRPATEQVLAMGPVASQVAIKQFGTNGGGFFNANSAHPFENPTPLSNFFEMLAILLIPAALCYTFGKMVKDTRQGWVLLAAMTAIFLCTLFPCASSEQGGNPGLASIGVDQVQTDQQPGGNMEGKEVRFGVANSVLWATATTAASNGSVNAMHDSFTPLGGLWPMWLIQLGEVVYGGVGSGLYGMLLFAIVAVFVAGLMVGRTPEYLGKKIEPFEMKMAALGILVTPVLVLVGTAVAVLLPVARAGVANPGAHGFSEILYAFSSASNNNGSAFASLGANTTFYNIALGICMFFGRYLVKIPVLAIAGSLATKGNVPVTSGTLPTHTPLFAGLLVSVVIIVGALTYIPALALGPIVEHLMMIGS